MVPDPAGRDSLLGEGGGDEDAGDRGVEGTVAGAPTGGGAGDAPAGERPPGGRVGVSFTMTLRAKSKLFELQDTPQLMPTGVETIVPWLVLLRLTVC